MTIYRGNSEFASFAAQFPFARVLSVCDRNTARFEAPLARLLTVAGASVRTFLFDREHLIPEIGDLSGLLDATEGYDYILAVGSGTLNDICKYASSKTGIPYGILATAPSMDGYVSSVSALYDGGKKVTLPTTIPTDVLIDVDILKNAPLDMIVAGAGDMIGKYTSLLDWKLGELLCGETRDAAISHRMEQAASLCMSRARDLTARDENAVSTLIEGLILSGVEMQNAGNSRPASGCEHHVSHYLEMAAEKRGTHFAPHGVQVALGTLIGISLYRYALERYPEALAALASDIEALPTVEALQTLYRDIGLPASFSAIGVDKELLCETVANAYTVRERFTVMSFLCERGELGTAARQLAELL